MAELETTIIIDSGELNLKGIDCLEYLFLQKKKECIFKIGILQKIKQQTTSFNDCFNLELAKTLPDFFARAELAFQSLISIEEFILKHAQETNKDKRLKLRYIIDEQIKLLKTNLYVE